MHPNGSDSLPQEIQRLETWLQIAGYLKVTDRCAQRWEKEEGLPVRRSGSRVYAYKHELDSWMEARQAPPPATVDNGQKPIEPAPVELPTLRKKSVVTVLFILVAAAFVGSNRYVHVRPGNLSELPTVKSRLLWRMTAEGGGLTSIALPETPDELAVSTDGKEVYVASRYRPVLMIVDPIRRAVSSLELPSVAHSIRVAGDGFAYLGSASNGVIVADPQARKVKEIIPTDGPVSDLVVTPEKGKLFVAMMARGVRRYDLRTRAWNQMTAVGRPNYIDLDARNQNLLVSYQRGGPSGRMGHDAIELFDVETETSRQVFSGPPLVGGQHRFSPDGNLIWLDGWDACHNANYDQQGCTEVPSTMAYLYRPADHQVLRSFTLPAYSGHPNFLRGGSRMVLTRDDLMVIDLPVGVVAERTRLKDSYSAGYGISPDRGTVYFARPESKDLLVLSEQPRQCADLPPGMAYHFTGDGVPNDVVAGAAVSPLKGVEYAPGFIGSAFSIDGDKRKLQLGPSFTMMFGPVDWSTAFYLKTSDSSGSIFEWIAGAPELGAWSLGIEANRVFLKFLTSNGDSIDLRSNWDLTPSWTHVAVTQHDRQFTLFLNGESAGTAWLPRSPQQHGFNRQMKFGWSDEQVGNFSGLIDEVGFWTRALNPEEVRQMYDVQRTAPCRP